MLGFEDRRRSSRSILGRLTPGNSRRRSRSWLETLGLSDGKRARHERSTAGRVAAGVAIGGAAFSVYYLLAGAREKNALLIPDSIEERLERVVYMLDRRFGRRWVDMGIDSLRSALTGHMPGPLAILIDVVYKVEKLGIQHGWTGEKKKAEAVREATTPPPV